MKKYNKFYLFFKITIYVAVFIALLPVNNIYAEEETLPNEADAVQTLEDELNALSEKVIGVDRSFADLNMEIKNIEENLTFFLMKKDKSFDITFLELLVDEDVWYTHPFTQKENEDLEKEDMGKRLAMLFWNAKKKQDTKITVRCFYKDKMRNVKNEYKLIREFSVSSEEKIMNYLSITLARNVKDKFKKKLDLELILW